MFRVVLLAVAYLLLGSHATVVKKNASPYVPQAKLAMLQGQNPSPSREMPEMSDTPAMMKEVGEVAELSGSVKEWLKNQQVTLLRMMAANQNGDGQAGVPDLLSARKDMDDLLSEFDEYTALMARMAQALGEIRMREAGIHA